MLRTGAESEPGTGKGVLTEEALGEVAGVGAVTLFTCSTLNRFFPPSPTVLLQAPAAGSSLPTPYSLLFLSLLSSAVCGSIHREDVADLVIKCLLSDKANGKTLSAVDSEQLFGSPSFEVFKV